MIELFSGIGGFRLGFEKNEWKTVWANDNDKYACQIYRKNFGNNELIEGNIRAIDADSIPNHDLLTAGFPCQSFSNAGKRKGFKENRGTLFFEIARIASVKRPALLLLENVKGLLNHDKGRTFAKILQTLDELGYDVEWQMLNSKHFGVPQNRERVFIVGHLRGTSTRQIFPVGKVSEVSSAETNSEPESKQASTLESSYGKNKSLSNMIVQACLTPDRINKRQNGRRFKEDGEPSFTLTGQDVHGVAIASAIDCDGYLRSGARPRDENGKPLLLPIGYRRIRRLTPVECERLQGFPDGYTDWISDTQRYKTLGNAVTVNVTDWLSKKLNENWR